MNPRGDDPAEQIRQWLSRTRDRLFGGGRAAHSSRRGRPQAIPMREAAEADDDDRDTGGFSLEGVDRNTFTLVLAIGLILLVVILFFVLSWWLGLGSSAAPATPTPAPAPAVAPKPAPPPPSPSPSPSPAPQPPSSGPRVHVVESGDTLSRIASRYGVTVEAVMQANNFTDRNRVIRIGERLNIPEPPPGAPARP